MRYSNKEINELLKYLEKREISPSDAIDIIQASTPEAKESNTKFNWKMMRFSMYLWQRLEEERGRNLNMKTESARIVVASKNFADLYLAYHDTGKGTGKFDPKNEAKKLFKLVTDPRQKHLFKPRFFVYPKGHQKAKISIPQDHIDYLMQFPKNSDK
jgi:hypothetical protein